MLDDSPHFRFISLTETTSTNTFLAHYAPPVPVDITLVTAEYQTSGRGQTGNHWESARGQNILFSVAVTPTSLPAAAMFCLSEAIALSIREVIAAALDKEGVAEAVTVKWPNDIYVGDRKIAGILIENTLRGAYVSRSIIGCGVNINQTHFESDAPNPVSLYQLTGRTTERRFILEQIVDAFRRRYASLQTDVDTSTTSRQTIHAAYLSVLYRREGLHPYRDANGTFKASIADVEPSGHLVLRDESGQLHRYAFKEVAYLH